eukprot:COSAG02_NODE_16653_length_1067_cov_0.642562_1_plen_179_part_10
MDLESIVEKDNPSATDDELLTLHKAVKKAAGDMGTGSCVWSEGTCVIGPSLDAYRCTAYAQGDKNKKALRSPVSSNMTWRAFDTGKKQWVAAPGDHCPTFCVTSPDPEHKLKQYMKRAIDDQQDQLEYMTSLLTPESLEATRKQLEEWRGSLGRAGFRAPGDGVRRHEFLQMKKKFYND